MFEVERVDGIALVWINDKEDKINKLNVAFMEEVKQVLVDLEQTSTAVILISGKPDCFIAGADIDMFAGLTEPGDAFKLCMEGHELLNRIAHFKVPVVAAINGACLGGGLEVALACHYRIGTDNPKTVFGVPEVKLGLLPGLGGTQRLPRLLGLQLALDLLLTGKNLYGKKAKKVGLLDQLVHPHGLRETALAFTQDILEKPPQRKKKKKLMTSLLEDTPMGRTMVYNIAQKGVMKQTAGNYPAPLKILDAVKRGLPKALPDALKIEAENFDELVRSPQSRALVQLFFGMTGTKKHPNPELVTPVKQIGILGAGLMGAGIAEVTLPKEINVVMKDISTESLGRGEQMIWKSFEKKVKKKIMSPFERDATMSRLHGTIDDRDLDSSDIVIEAVFEDLELKQKMLAQVEASCGERCIFASNTSSLPITQIAAKAKRPELVIGMHYFSPVPKMPLLEIIVTPQTADWVTATAIDLGIKQGKNVIVVNDGPGFYTTRILAPLLNEAVLLLEEGAAIEDLDKIMFAFGFPVGPVTLIDEVGIDVGAHVGRVLGHLFEARGAKPNETMEKLYKAGYLGRKNGKGFYRYDQKKKKVSNQEIYQFFGGPSRKKIPVTEVEDRLALVMVNEAAYCLEEGILNTPQDGDLGAILGLGFPPFLGGPFRYMDRVGAGKIRDRLKELEQKHGGRFTPAGIIGKSELFYSK